MSRLRVAKVPIGLISVMPQPWRTWMPSLWKRSIMLRGGAVPPTHTRLSLPVPLSEFSTWLRKSSQIVGTAAEWVTPSFSISAWIVAPLTSRPGSTSLAPTAAAQ